MPALQDVLPGFPLIFSLFPFSARRRAPGRFYDFIGVTHANY